MNRLPLALDDFHQWVRNKTERDPGRDAGRKRHGQDDEKRGERFIKIIPPDVLNAAQHQAAHYDERGCRNGGQSGNCADQRTEKAATTNNAATTTAVNPVRPPAPTPAADST